MIEEIKKCFPKTNNLKLKKKKIFLNISLERVQTFREITSNTQLPSQYNLIIKKIRYT